MESNRIKWERYALLFLGIVYLFIYNDFFFSNKLISIETADYIISEYSHSLTYSFGFNLALTLLLIWQAFYIKYPIAKVVLLMLLFFYAFKNLWMLLWQLSMGGPPIF